MILYIENKMVSHQKIYLEANRLTSLMIFIFSLNEDNTVFINHTITRTQ